MCKITVTKCVSCQEFIDSVVERCHDRGEVEIDNVPIPQCHNRHGNGTVDGYAIRTPQELEYPSVIGRYGGRDVTMHRQEIVTGLCFWCSEDFKALGGEEAEEALEEAKDLVGDISRPVWKSSSLPPVNTHMGYLVKVAARKSQFHSHLAF